MNHLRSNVCCHTSTKNILPNKLKLAWIGHTCAVLHSLSVCTAISRKLVEECIRPRFQAFAPVVHINGRHYLNVTTQNAQQKEHLKSQFLKEQSLGGKTDGREESCSCYSRLHARHAVRFRPATGSRIHRVLWVLRQLLPWLQWGQPSVSLHNQVRGVLRRRLTRGVCRRAGLVTAPSSASPPSVTRPRPVMGQLMPVLQQLVLTIAQWTGTRTRTSTHDNDRWWPLSCQWIMKHELTVHNYRR